MILSERLKLIISLIESCGCAADIGCDHAYAAIEAVKSGRALMAAASDVAAGPLKAAEKNAALAGVSDRISFIKADGLKGVIAEKERLKPECLIIAGMGGHLMRSILEDLSELKPYVRQLILSPQSDKDTVRHFLTEEPWLFIKTEYTVFEDGKYYTVIDVRSEADKEAEVYEEYEYLFGKHIAAETLGVYKSYLSRQRDIDKRALEAALAGAAYAKDRASDISTGAAADRCSEPGRLSGCGSVSEPGRLSGCGSVSGENALPDEADFTNSGIRRLMHRISLADKAMEAANNVIQFTDHNK